MTNAITSAARRLVGAAVLTLGVAACSTAGSSPAATAATSASAGASFDVKAEIDAVVAGLDQVLTLYKGGNVQGALDAVAETYEEHFEHVEDPLGGRNHELMEDIEGLISTKLRAAINGNQPAAAVEALITEAKGKLATAKGLF